MPTIGMVVCATWKIGFAAVWALAGVRFACAAAPAAADAASSVRRLINVTIFIPFEQPIAAFIAKSATIDSRQPEFAVMVPSYRLGDVWSDECNCKVLSTPPLAVRCDRVRAGINPAAL